MGVSKGLMTKAKTQPLHPAFEADENPFVNLFPFQVNPVRRVTFAHKIEASKFRMGATLWILALMDSAAALVTTVGNSQAAAG
jgi:hypothetical protein